MRKYRQDLKYNEVVVGEYNHGEKMLYVDEVEATLNLIENRVNEICNLLESIKGLDVIDEAKEKLEALSVDLY